MAAQYGLKASVNDPKTVGHLERYVFPFFTKKQRASVVKKLTSRLPFLEVLANQKGLLNYDGEHATDKTTHVLLRPSEKTKANGSIRMVDVEVEGNSLYAVTDQKEKILFARIAKPAKLKKRNGSAAGFKIEDVIRTNIGDTRTNAGQGLDFVWGDVVRGKVQKIRRYLIAGESKLVRGKMGQVTVEWKDTGWVIKDSPYKALFEATLVDGVPIIEHMNKNFPDGVVHKGFNTPAATGISEGYLKNHGANFLHVHMIDPTLGSFGTTYSVGESNRLKGKTGCQHLTPAKLRKLDGSITVEKSYSAGRVYFVHKPSEAQMKRLAKEIQNDPARNIDLTKKEDANRWLERVSNWAKENQINYQH